MLTPSQLETFRTDGILRIPALVDSASVGSFRATLLRHLEQQGVEIAALADGDVVTPSLFRRIVDAVSFGDVFGAGVRSALDQLLGEGSWREPKSAGQVLFIAAPRPDAPWELPHKVWHLDYPAPGGPEGLPGVHAFLCLDRIARRGGGTLAISGSSRMIDRIRVEAGERFEGRSAEVRSRLAARVPWYAELCTLRAGEDRVARFMEETTEVEGIGLRVVELTGDAGDVILVHPWTLHNLSPNCSERPRLVITERIHRR